MTRVMRSGDEHVAFVMEHLVANCSMERSADASEGMQEHCTRRTARTLPLHPSQAKNACRSAEHTEDKNEILVVIHLSHVYI